MNNRTLILACCALVGLSAGAARAQLEVSLTLDQGVYIVGEPVRADVVIVNHFPVPFGIGPGIDYRQNGLSFEIVDNARDTLDPWHPDSPMIATLMLPPGAMHQAAFELDEWYPLARTGSYIVKASVRRDDRRYDSQARAITVVPGLEIQCAVQLFADGSALQRKLALVYFMRRQGEYLFLRATDMPGERVWTTLELGRLLRTTAPTLAISPEGEVTIVHRATQDMFLRTRVRSTARGVLLVGQERVVDPQVFMTEQAQQFVHDAENRKKDSVGSWWWPFGGSSSSGKSP